MKHGELVLAGGHCWRPRRTSGPLTAVGSRGDDHLSGIAISLVQKGLGAPLVLHVPRDDRRGMGEAAERHQQAPGDPKPSISDEALLVVEADLDGIPLGGRGTAQRLGGVEVCRALRVSRADARSREQPGRVSLPPTWRRGSSPMLMWGTCTAFGCSRWTTAGVHRHRAGRVQRLASLLHATHRIGAGPSPWAVQRLARTVRRAARLALRGSQYLRACFTAAEALAGSSRPAFVELPQTIGVAASSIATAWRDIHGLHRD